MLKEYEKVSYELLKPYQVKEIREQCPIVYITAGSLEWHGRQNPLGTDSLISHAMCCEAALLHGGIVLPPYYLGFCGDSNWGPAGWDGYTLGFNKEDVILSAMHGLCRGLVNAGWKVLAGVTGHAVPEQREAMRSAIDSETDGLHTAGFAIYEGELHIPDKEIPFVMDHAGAWETSCMIYTYPDTVDINLLNNSPSIHNDNMICNWNNLNEEYDGIQEKNPVKFASYEMGRKIVKSMGNRIGEKAKETLVRLII